MPRLVATTAFEDLGYMNLPLLDFKFVRLTPRQFIVLLISAGLAFAVFSAVQVFDVMYGLFAAVAFFTVCATFFVRRGHVFPPEWYLLYFVKKAFAPLNPKRAGGRQIPKKSPKPEPIEAKPMVVPMGEPRRIAGVLFDPSTGTRLSSTAYEVEVDGKPYDSGCTDKDGAYSIVFTPPTAGRFTVAIKPKGHARNAEVLSIESFPPSEAGRRSLPPAPLSPEKNTGEESPAPKTAKPEYEYVYELFPMNFVDLPDQEQDRAVDSFRRFLNSLDEGVEVKLTTVRSSKEIAFKDYIYDTTYFRFFIQSKRPIDAQLDDAGLSYQRTTESPEPKITYSSKLFTAVEGGKTLQTATIYNLPPQLVEGFPCELYGYVDRITLTITPLPQDTAVYKLDKYFRLRLGAAFGGRAQQTEMLESQKAQEALSRITSGASKLFMIHANITVGGSSAAELKEAMKRVKSYCKGRLFGAEASMFVQADYLRGKLGKKLYVDTITLGAFFPFVSADMVETPGGVCLGINRATGAPVVFDPYLRMNQNIALIGVPGAGKSMAAKIFLTRLAERDPDISFYIIDPENEYTPTALGIDKSCQVTHVGRKRDLGLDPFLLFPDSKDLVLDALANILDLSDEPDLFSELSVGVQQSRTLKELRQRAKTKLKKRLDGLLKGPMGFLFRGTSAPIEDRAVFSFLELHQALRASGQKIGALNLASLLIFGKIWQKIEAMPRDRLKVILVDEVWLYSTIPAAASFLDNVSRRGRKRNVVFVFCSQRPEDVLGSESIRAAIQNCATKGLLSLDESSAELIRKTFNLTESEIERCLNFRPGDAILLSKGIRVPIHFDCSPREYSIFTTKPKEML